jgi:serine protease inhibitor
MMTCGAARPPEDEIDFILDRPFLFLITSRDNLPLFAGVVENP